MMLTLREVKLCFFLAFRVGKVAKLRFLVLLASIGVLQERQQKVELALGIKAFAYNTAMRDMRKEISKLVVVMV